MARITPQPWQVLECIFTKAGFVFDREKGDHKLYVRKNTPRPIVIPTEKDVAVFIIKNNMRTAGMSREEYFKLLEECK